MSYGNINRYEVLGPKYPLEGQLKSTEWDQKRKYEENGVLVDLRALDLDGTLEVTKSMDRSLCKAIPDVDIIDGCLVLKIKRER